MALKLLNETMVESAENTKKVSNNVYVVKKINAVIATKNIANSCSSNILYFKKHINFVVKILKFSREKNYLLLHNTVEKLD